jgi:hypothetical protein
MQEGLDQHFAAQQALYVRREHPLARHPLARVHAQPIISDPGYVTEYAFKSLARGRVSTDDIIIILPRSRSELPQVSDRISRDF